MQRTISPFLLFLQVVAVSMLVAGAAILVRVSDEGNYGLYAVLYFGAAALVIPAYQIYVWASTARKGVSKPVAEDNERLLRDSEDGMWPE